MRTHARRIGLACILAPALAWGMPSPASAAMCPTTATVLCLEKVSYNYRVCGRLRGADGARERLPTCYDREENVCAPCRFEGTAGTSRFCEQVFGPNCGYFELKDEQWDNSLPGLTLPDLDLSGLFDWLSFDWLTGAPEGGE